MPNFFTKFLLSKLTTAGNTLSKSANSRLTATAPVRPSQTQDSVVAFLLVRTKFYCLGTAYRLRYSTRCTSYPYS